MILFGTGALYGTPTQDAFGNAIANGTPVKFGVLQDVSLDVSFDTKLLYGNQQFAVAVGRGKGKIAAKAKTANLNGQILNSLFFGQTSAASGVGVVNDTTGIAIPATPFTVTASTTNTATTIQIPNTGTWSNDLGVIYAATGIPLTRVASAPAVGQYSFTAGAYLFAAADVGLTVFINYEYTYASTTTSLLNVNNVLMGYAPSFSGELSVPFQGKQLTCKFYNAVASKFSMATKQDDFIVPEFDFDIFSNQAGQVLTFSVSS